MKKLICLLSFAAVLLTGCERLDEMDTRLSGLDSRVAALENKLELLNITNKHYEIIRNYPMQGFGLRFKVVYDFG